MNICDVIEIKEYGFWLLASELLCCYFSSTLMIVFCQPDIVIFVLNIGFLCCNVGCILLPEFLQRPRADLIALLQEEDSEPADSSSSGSSEEDNNYFHDLLAQDVTEQDILFECAQKKLLEDKKRQERVDTADIRTKTEISFDKKTFKTVFRVGVIGGLLTLYLIFDIDI